MKTICIQITDDGKVIAYRENPVRQSGEDAKPTWSERGELKLHAAVVAKNLEKLIP